MAGPLRTSAASDRLNPIVPLLGALGVAAFAAMLGPEGLTTALIALIGITIIALRPQWGVATIMFLLMVQYGTRRYEREGVAGLASLVPAGSGFLTVNNVLGIFLALLLVFHVYRDGDWSTLKNRQVQLVIAITMVLVVSGLVSGIVPEEQADIGLFSTRGQDPARMLITRALFLVLFVFFMRKPRDLRMIVGLFVVLAVATAWSGSGAAITGSGRPEIADYRAGGLEVLIESTQNPNRLALISTLALVLIWEYSQAHRLKRFAYVAMALGLLMIVTVFLAASRGGVIGLAFAGLLLFLQKRGGSTRVFYGVAAVILGWILISEIVPEEALERISNIPGISNSESTGEGEGSVRRRSYTYGVGIDIWKTAPIVGIGPGNWPFVRFVVDPVRSAAAPHNAYLKALAEGGLVTLGLYLALFWVTIRELWQFEHTPAVMARARADGLDWLVSAARVCLLTFMVFSLFADLWDLVFAYFLVGIAAVLINRYRPLVPAIA